MKKMTIMACALSAMLSMAVFAACSKQNEEQKKYDVAIRVACSDRTSYKFPVGEDERHITIRYDGQERTYWVDSYNLPDHPRYSDDWFAPSGEGANVFGKTMSYCPPGGLNKAYSGPVKEIGEYCIVIEADSTSDLWNFRSVYLFISVV